MLDKELTSCLKSVKTPSYVFNIDEFHQRAALVHSVFGDNIGLCFSIKANPFLIKALPDCIEKLEVCSPGELDICIGTGADMKSIIFSGVNKSYADVEKAFLSGVVTFTAESLNHLSYINAAGEKFGTKIDVLLRVSAETQFGMDEQIVRWIIAERESYPYVNIVGLHYFTGTQKKRAKQIEREMDYLSSLIDSIRSDYQFTVERVEYGTGLYVEYFSQNGDEDEAALLNAVAPSLKRLSEKTALTVEMGRFFAAGCGYYFTKVVDCKKNDGINFAICDGGMHQLHYDGQIQGMKIPSISHLRVNEASDGNAPEKWTLCGSLCTTADVIVRDVELASLSEGDVLVFKKTGAYSHMEGMSIFLSRDLPQIWLTSEKDGMALQRDSMLAFSFNMPK